MSYPNYHKAILSHTIFPENILKSFYDHETIVYLNAQTGQLTKSTNNCERFFAFEGWFSQDCERFLCADYETKFSTFSRSLTKHARGKKHNLPNITPTNISAIFKLFAYQQLRDSGHTLALASKLGLFPSHPFYRSLQNWLIADEFNFSFLSSSLEKIFAPKIWLNYSDLKFVAINTPIKKHYPDGSVILYAASPHLAIALFPKDMFLSSDSASTNIEILDNAKLDFVHEINSLLVAHAITYSPNIVLGQDKEYLFATWNQVKERLI